MDSDLEIRRIMEVRVTAWADRKVEDKRRIVNGQIIALIDQVNVAMDNNIVCETMIVPVAAHD